MKQRFFLDALGDRLLETATKGTPGDKSGGGTGFDSITSRWTGLRRMNSTSGSLRRARQTATDRLTMRIRYIPVMVLTLGSYAMAQARPSETLDSLHKRAESAYDRGDIQRAITLYREILKRDPDSLPVRTDLGVALAREGHYREALDEYQQALRHDPENSIVRLNLAIAWYKLADFENAAAELENFRKREPQNLQSLYLLADCYLRLGKNREAISLLDPVYVNRPDDLAVDYALGTALIRDGQTQRGAKVIDRVLRNGGSAIASLLLGESQFDAGDYKTAASTIRNALDLDPNLPGAWVLYGRALLQGGDLAGAKDALLRAIQADPNDFDANLHLGATLRHDGKNVEAVPYLKRALQLRPASPEARFQIGALDLAMGHLEDARSTLENLEKKWPDFQEVHVQLATLYARINRPADSQRERDIVLKLNESARQKGPQPEH